MTRFTDWTPQEQRVIDAAVREDRERARRKGMQPGVTATAGRDACAAARRPRQRDVRRRPMTAPKPGDTVRIRLDYVGEVGDGGCVRVPVDTRLDLAALVHVARPDDLPDCCTVEVIAWRPATHDHTPTEEDQ